MNDGEGADPRRPVADDLRRVVARLDALVASTGDAEPWLAPTDRGGWSAVACLEHLSTTAEAASRRLVAASGREGRLVRSARPRSWVRLFVRMQEPPARFRTRTGAAFRPDDRVDLDGALERFRRTHFALADDVEAIEARNLHRVCIESPFGPRHYTALEWGLVLAAHARRHLWQAEGALEEARARSS